MSFANDVDRSFKNIRAQLQKHTIRIANDGYSSVVSLSPVDTGFFRNEWQYYPQEYPTINIRNDTEYGPYLENGSSKQAPGGMVRVTYNYLVGKYT